MAALNRLAVDGVLTGRVGGVLAEAGMTAAGVPNPHLEDPLSWALRLLGYSPALLATVSDADLALVAAGHVDALLDLAELRALESVLTNLVKVDTKAGPVDEAWASLGDRLATLVPAKRKAVAAMYGGLLVRPLDGTSLRVPVLRAL